VGTIEVETQCIASLYALHLYEPSAVLCVTKNVKKGGGWVIYSIVISITVIYITVMEVTINEVL